MYRMIRKATGTKVPRSTARYAANVTSRDSSWVGSWLTICALKQRNKKNITTF